MGHQVIGMEDYAAADERPLDKCLQDIGTVDIYVGIVAWRNGFVPTEGNAQGRSITELEYRHAGDSARPRLIFLADRSAAWPVDSIDAVAENSKNAAAVRRLRRTLEEDRTVAYFSSPESLANEVAAAVGFHLQADSWLADAMMTAATQGEIDRFSPTGREGAVEQWRLGSSLYPELEEKLVSILHGIREFDYAIINLEGGRAWWSTRLFLFAAVASDYTALGHLVFLYRKRYIGTATARETHLKLARHFPRFELAYRGSRPPAGDMPAEEEIVNAIGTFSYELGLKHLPEGIDDERKIKEWVSETNLLKWLGTSLHTDAAGDPGERPTLLDVYDILQKASSHVALLKDDGSFSRLVNRDAVALGAAKAVARQRLGQASP